MVNGNGFDGKIIQNGVHVMTNGMGNGLTHNGQAKNVTALVTK